MKKVSVIGAGNVGATCAFALLVKDTGEIALIDKVPGLAEGKALDIAQSKVLWDSDSRIFGNSDYEQIKGSDAVVITAGSPRKPGMSRSELLGTNARIMNEIVGQIKNYCPEAVVIIVANPVDNLTYYALKISGFNPSKVIGMSGTVDSSRLKYFFSETACISAKEAGAMVVGPHSDSMIPILKGESGKERKEPLNEPEKNEIFEKTKNAGAQIVSFLKTGSAFYTPGTAAAVLAEAVVNDRGLQTEASVLLSGQYGIEDVCIGVPVVVGGEGIKEIAEVPLSDSQLQLLQQAAGELKNDNGELPL